MISAASLLAMAQWYCAIAAVAWLAFPLALIVVPHRPGLAWGLGRCVSLPACAYLAWLAASIGLAGFGVAALAGALAVLAVSSGLVCLLSRDMRRSLPRWPGAVWRVEAIYVLIFAVVAAIRACPPDLFGLEKFMNFAFMNAAYYTASFPPVDPWFAGKPLNYYYFGHAVAAAGTHLAGVKPELGYNLMFAHVFAAGGAGIFALVQRLLQTRPGEAALAQVAATLAALVTILGGNMHPVIFGVVRPYLEVMGWIGAPRSPYFFPESSRFVGFNPPTTDKTIIEFPAYSVVVGDLHAHVLNMPVAVALITLCVQTAASRPWGWPWRGRPASRRRRVQRLSLGALLALLIAISGMSNAWDVPIYLGLLGLALLWRPGAFREMPGAAIAGATVDVALVALAALFAAWPFWHHFEPFSQGLQLVTHGTPLWQLAVLYGNYILLAACAAAVLLRPPAAGWNRRIVALAGLLVVAAICVLAVPETVGIKDIYGPDFQRGNTMFKTSYQAYLLLPPAAVTLGAAAMRRLSTVAARMAFGIGFGALALSPLVFLWFPYDQNLRPAPGHFMSLNGIIFLPGKSAGDYAIREYLIRHRPGPGQTILEASGDSYTYAARISATTGIPTLLGWHVHEWLWRKEPRFWQERAELVSKFYTRASREERLEVIRRFNIRYVVIGDFERERYPGLDEAGLAGLGRVVLEAGGTRLIEIGDPS